jgi:hypothetical protein
MQTILRLGPMRKHTNVHGPLTAARGGSDRVRGKKAATRDGLHRLLGYDALNASRFAPGTHSTSSLPPPFSTRASTNSRSDSLFM